MPGARPALHDMLGLEATFGARHMLHRRRRAVDDRWEACSASDPLRQADSGLHRYSRVVGFSVGDEERRILANDPLAAQAEESARNRVRSQSHSQSHPVQVVPARALLARAPPGRHRVRRLAEAPAPHQRHGGRSKLLGCALLLCRRGRLKGTSRRGPMSLPQDAPPIPLGVAQLSGPDGAGPTLMMCVTAVDGRPWRW
jgi:hypothetical protein